MSIVFLFFLELPYIYRNFWRVRPFGFGGTITAPENVLKSYTVGCCSNTFLAGLFRRLFAVVFVILHCLVFCYFCVRVLLFLRSCSVILAFVFCYFCVRVLLFLRSCSVIFVFVFCYFCVCVLLFWCSCSVIFAFLFCYFCVTEQMWTFYRTNVEILQNKCGHFTEHMWKFYRTNVEILQNKMWKFYR